MNPSAFQLDALSELMNIGVGRAAGMLNEMIGSPIELYVPTVQVLCAADLPKILERRPDQVLSFVRLPFRGSIQGTAALVFPTDSAAKLVSVLTGDDLENLDLDSLRAGTLSEVGNIVINGVMGSIANILSVVLEYDLPSYLEAPLAHLFGRQSLDPNPAVLVAQTRFTAKDLEIRGTILLVFEVLAFDTLLRAIDVMSTA